MDQATVLDRLTALGEHIATNLGSAVTDFEVAFGDLTINIERNPDIPYDPHGRNQNEGEARAADEDVKAKLRELEVPHLLVMNEGVPTIMAICREIVSRRGGLRVDAETAPRTEAMLEQLAACEALR